MTTTKTLILEAYAKSEYGEGPAWARVSLTPEFMATVERVSALCAEHSLHSATTLDAPDEWDSEDEFRLRGDELIVAGSSLWFTCYPKHAGYECETRIMEISDLRKVVAGETPDEFIDEFIVEGDIVFQNETAKENYTEHLADQTQEQD